MLSDVDMMLKDTPFYTSVDNEEKRKVYAQEFTGTGHFGPGLPGPGLPYPELQLRILI